MPVSYEQFCQQFHLLQSEGRKPTYDELSRALGISKTDVAVHMKRLRIEFPHSQARAKLALSPALLKAYESDVQAGLACERQAYLEELDLREKNEQSLITENQSQQIELDAARQGIKTLQEERAKLQIQRDSARESRLEMEKRLHALSQELAVCQAKSATLSALEATAKQMQRLEREWIAQGMELKHAREEIGRKEELARNLNAEYRKSQEELQKAKEEIAVLNERLRQEQQQASENGQ